MKKLLLPFFCMSCVSAISAQNIPEDADTLSIGLKEVKVMASYGHDKGVEPVVLSTISAKDIATKLSNQEFPEITKSYISPIPIDVLHRRNQATQPLTKA